MKNYLSQEEIQKFLITRFLIIADYPGNEFGKVGDVVDRDWAGYTNGDETKEPIWKISQFPHLFRKLEWFECRKEEEMPLYVKYLVRNNKFRYLQIKWYVSRPEYFSHYFHSTNGVSGLIDTDYYPITEKEFNEKFNEYKSR